MTHYRLSDSMPSAIILARNPRTSSLDELKTYQENDIFLNNGDEFQVRLFNPLREKIGAQLSINGKLSNRLLVLNPGETADIDRFIDEKRRMMFETYKYDDNNPAAKNAIANNGLIEIKFFKEFQPYYYNLTTSTFNLGNTTGAPYYGNNTTLTSSSVFNCSTSLDFNSPGVPLQEVDRSVKSSRKLSKSKLKETGIVSKGEESNQEFKSVNIQFESFPFHTISYKLKPMSEKNSYSTEVRDYCTSCGYRIRNDKWMYCPKCGNKV